MRDFCTSSGGPVLPSLHCALHHNFIHFLTDSRHFIYFDAMRISFILRNGDGDEMPAARQDFYVSTGEDNARQFTMRIYLYWLSMHDGMPGGDTRWRSRSACAFDSHERAITAIFTGLLPISDDARHAVICLRRAAED